MQHFRPIKKSEPLPSIFSKLAKKVAEAYKEEIQEPAEIAIREWLEECVFVVARWNIKRAV